MQLGVANGTVWLVGDALPTEWNGMTLEVVTLDDAQLAAWDELPAERGGTTFDGKVFAAVALEAVVTDGGVATVVEPLPKFLTADDLAAYLREKGLI